MNEPQQRGIEDDEAEVRRPALQPGRPRRAAAPAAPTAPSRPARRRRRSGAAKARAGQGRINSCYSADQLNNRRCQRCQPTLKPQPTGDRQGGAGPRQRQLLQLLEFRHAARAQRRRAGGDDRPQGVEHVAAPAGAAPGSARDLAQGGAARVPARSPATTVQMCRLLRGVAENRLAEVDKLVRDFIGHRDELEPVPAASARPGEARPRAGARRAPAGGVRGGALPGAVNIPIKQLENRLAELPKRKEIVVAYCRGPYCLMSFDAVDKLRKRASRPAPSGRVPGMESGRAAGRAVSASCIADEPDRGGEHLVPA